MLKIVSAMLLAAMFIGCSNESATTEEANVTEAAMPAEEVAAPVEANATDAAMPAEEANATAAN